MLKKFNLPDIFPLNYWFYFTIILSIIIFSPLGFFLPKEIQLITFLEKAISYSTILLIIFLTFDHIKKHRLISDPFNISSSKINLLLGIFGISYFLSLIFTTLSGYHSLFFGVFDFSGISTVISSFKTYGSFLHSPFYIAKNGSEFFLAHHFSPILLLLSPAYLFTSSHLTYGIELNIIHIVFLFLFFIYMKSHFNSSISIMLILSLLHFPYFYYAGISYHFEMLILPSSMIYFIGLKQNKRILKYIGIILMYSIKEDIPVYFTLFGFYLILNKNYRKDGLILVSAGILYFLIVTKVLMPYLSGARESGFLTYWSYGSNLNEMVIYLLQHPEIILIKFYAKKRIFLSLVLPLAFLPLLNLRFLLIVLLPIMIIHFLSDHILFGQIGVYYSYTILPFILYIIPENLLVAQKFIASYLQSSRAKIIPLLLLVFFTSREASMKKDQPFFYSKPNKNEQLFLKIQKMIPPEKSIHTDSYLIHLFPVTRKAYFLTDMSHPPEYFLFDKNLIPRQFDNKEDVDLLFALVQKEGYLLVNYDSIYLFKIPPEKQHIIINKFNLVKFLTK